MTQATQLRMCFTCYTEKPVEVFSKPQPNTCKQCISTRQKKRYRDNPAVRDRMLKTSRAYYKANRDKMLTLGRETWVERRAEATRIYGGVCARCGGTDRLEFDHVNADGMAHRKRESNTSMVLRIVREGARLTDVEIQLLCHDHHWEKTLAERRARRAARG